MIHPLALVSPTAIPYVIKIANRERLRTSLHSVESALRGMPANQMIPGTQAAFDPNNASYQVSAAGVHGLSEEFERNMDAATGIAEIILGFKMMGGGTGITFGTGGTGIFVGAPMVVAGAVMTADGLRRLAWPIIAENTRRFSNVLYNKRNSSGKVDKKPDVRTEPKNLKEKLTLEEAKSAPGKRIMKGKIKDPRFQKEWKKMRYIHTNPDGTKIEIHFWEHESSCRNSFL